MVFFGHTMADSNIVGISPLLRVDTSACRSNMVDQFSFEVYCRAYVIKIFSPAYVSADAPATEPDAAFLEEYNKLHKRVQSLLS